MTTNSSPSAASYASPSLYVGDLASEVTEALLFDVFSGAGSVASVRVCRDASTRRSLGYAYVNYHRIEDAEKALETLNFKSIRGRNCRIMWSIRDPSIRRSGQGNIFVHGLNKDIDNKQLWDTFSIFGNILSCKVVTNTKGDSNGYGFVHFESDESASQAIEKVNGKMIADCVVTVERFKSKKDRGLGSQTVFTNIFVKNLGSKSSQDDLTNIFKAYGPITSSVLRVDVEKDRAYGFVNFASPDNAKTAVDELNGKEVNGRVLYVGRAMKKSEREREIKHRYDQYRQERTQKYANLNLFVKNLAETIDDDRLKAEFAKFGTITSAKIVRDGQISRGFGFVCFSTPEEATRAVTELNGRMLDGKPLYVALHQRKDVRRAHLEQSFASRSRAHGPGMYGGIPNFPNMMSVYPRMYGGLVPLQQQQRGGGQFRGQQQFRGQFPSQPMMMHPAMLLSHQYPQAQQQVGVPPRQNQQPRQPRPNNNTNYRQQQQQQAAAPNQTGFKYSENVRNPRAAPQQVAPVAQAVEPVVVQQLQQVPLDPSQPLTAAALAQAPPELQKQMIGERLFPLIKNSQPELAGKITGMLLEMDNLELLHLLESAPALTEKIEEAITVLQTTE